MNRLLQRAVNRIMSAFAGSGVHLDASGQLCLPDGLCPTRVHRFIELCMDRRFPAPREAMHALFLRVGVDGGTVGLLDRILSAEAGVAMGEAVRHSGALLASLPELQRIPGLFRDFLVHDVGLAAHDSPSLEDAVRSTRERAAARLGCAPSWDAILAHPDALVAWTRPWRERVAAA